jgi:hypothetical protein
MPSIVGKYCGTFGIINATTLPGARLCDCSHAAMAFEA